MQDNRVARDAYTYRFNKPRKPGLGDVIAQYTKSRPAWSSQRQVPPNPADMSDEETGTYIRTYIYYTYMHPSYIVLELTRAKPCL